MTNNPLYHDGMRQLQDARETRRIADRLEQVTVRTTFTDEDRAFIQRCPMFFVATADARGHPDCSYKGGLPGFVRVLNDCTLAFPDYDGNGMYRSWGNILVNPNVGLLFLDFENPKRIRVNGTAHINLDDPFASNTPVRYLLSVSLQKKSFQIVPATSTRCSLLSIQYTFQRRTTRPPFLHGKRLRCFMMPCRTAITILTTSMQTIHPLILSARNKLFSTLIF